MSIPPESPVTSPVAETDAVLFVVLHTPPVTGSKRVIIDPAQVLTGPDIVPADGIAMTLIG